MLRLELLIQINKRY